MAQDILKFMEELKKSKGYPKTDLDEVNGKPSGFGIAGTVADISAKKLKELLKGAMPDSSPVPYDAYGTPVGEPPAKIPKKGMGRKLTRTLYKDLEKEYAKHNTPPITKGMEPLKDVLKPEDLLPPVIDKKDLPPPVPEDSIKSIDDIRKAADDLINAPRSDHELSPERSIRLSNKNTSDALGHDKLYNINKDGTVMKDKDLFPEAYKKGGWEHEAEKAAQELKNSSSTASTAEEAIVSKSGKGIFSSIKGMSKGKVLAAAAVGALLLYNKLNSPKKTSESTEKEKKTEYKIPEGMSEPEKEVLKKTQDTSDIFAAGQRDIVKRLTGRDDAGVKAINKRNKALKAIEKAKKDLEEYEAQFGR